MIWYYEVSNEVIEYTSYIYINIYTYTYISIHIFTAITVCLQVYNELSLQWANTYFKWNT